MPSWRDGRKFKGKCASVDSWTGGEIASLPLEVLEHAATLFNLIESIGKALSIWTMARHAHLPKEAE